MTKVQPAGAEDATGGNEEIKQNFELKKAKMREISGLSVKSIPAQ